MPQDRLPPDAPFRRYTTMLFACLAIPPLLLAAFVVAVDPYYVFGSPSWRGFNEVRPYYEPHVDIAKPYQIRRLKPEAVSLGSSRVEVGIDPRHPGWGTSKVFDFALPSSNSYLVMLAFLHAQAVGQPLKRAVVGLDFFAYNIEHPLSADIFGPRFVDAASRGFATYLDQALPERRTRTEASSAASTGLDEQPFSEALYLAVNPDVAAAIARHEFTSGRDHYERAGRTERRPGVAVPEEWNETAYLEIHPDVKTAVSEARFVNGYHHYLVAGRAEGRVSGFVPSDWSEQRYFALNPSARILAGLGGVHSGYASYIRNGGASGGVSGGPPRTAMEWAMQRWPSLVSGMTQFKDWRDFIFSATAVREAALTISRQHEPATFDGLGMRIWSGHDAEMRKLGGSGTQMRRYLLARRWNLWFKQPRYHYCFTNPQTGMTTFDAFRYMIREAYAGDTDMRLFITPLHVAVRTMITNLGLGERYEFWMSELVRINSEEAARGHRDPFPLWDFSDANTITRTEIPEPGDLTPMKWYWEVSHYRRETGDLMLDRILDHHEPGRSVPADFGVRLGPANVEGHLEETRSGLSQWAAAHSAFATQLANAAQHPEATTRQSQATCW